MKDALRKLLADFLSTIAFLAIYGLTGHVAAATLVAIAIAIGQFVHARLSGKSLGAMTVASLALAIVLGGATLLTNDPRFVLVKPCIGHFAIGAIMLRRGWMLRYLPPIVSATIPRAVTFAGYAWAGLMFVLGAGVIAVAMTGDLWLWGVYVGVVAIGAKIVAFVAQFVAFRLLVRRAFRRDPALAATFGVTVPARPIG
jgi:intracellular septation protein A